jgi:hypothetical protein
MPLRVISSVPPTLVAIFVALIINEAADLGTLTVSDKATVAGDFPSWSPPDVKWNWKLIGAILPHSVTWALISECSLCPPPLAFSGKTRIARLQP